MEEKRSAETIRDLPSWPDGIDSMKIPDAADEHLLDAAQDNDAWWQIIAARGLGFIPGDYVGLGKMKIPGMKDEQALDAAQNDVEWWRTIDERGLLYIPARFKTLHQSAELTIQ
ncbi:hypothetical protein V1599_20830 [Enterobacter sp. ECC-175]|uniref:hypothetical protein n=1 Tax=unclassified Enterobacter TaxID=2608935 RepID=UPI000D4E8F81|nr:hypothetical protein [Enterobacter sp. RIT 418]RAU29879.1 hypothetical protein DBY73_021535 [Enterobacter sp. RIT 418]